MPIVQLRAWPLLLQHHDLRTQGHVLKNEISSRTSHRADGTDQKGDQDDEEPAHEGAILSAPGAAFKASRTGLVPGEIRRDPAEDLVLAKHRADPMC